MDVETTSAPAAAAPVELTPQQSAQIMARYRLEQQVLSGANQFFWIAGLTLVNSVLYIVGTSWVFFIGLAATQLIDGFAQGVSSNMANGGFIVRIFGLGLDVFIAGMFVFFGYFARKHHGWAFGIGMVLYALDGIVLLLVGSFIGVALHVFFLWLIFGGVRALRKLGVADGGLPILVPQVGVADSGLPILIPPPSAPKRTWRDRSYWLRLGYIPLILIGMVVVFLVLLVVVAPK